jgi:uncharacterized protein DUF4412
MRKTVLIIVFIVSIFTASFAAAADYSADLESVSPVGTITSKVYVRDNLQRMEMSAAGKQAVMILRGDKKVVWMLMPENRLYVEMPMDPRRDFLPPFNALNVRMEKDLVGEENVDGHRAKKYHVNVQRNGKMERSGFVWEAADLDGLTVRFQTEDKSTTMTWKNIKRDGAESSIFDIPEGYKKIDAAVPPPPAGK